MANSFQIHRVRFSAAIAIATLSLILSGCAESTLDSEQISSYPSSTAPNGQDYRFPSTSAGDFTFSWTSLPGINLYSRAAEVTRAYFESCQLTKNLVGQTYPGSGEANLREPGGSYCLQDYREKQGIPFSGTVHARINRLEETSDQITANVCVEVIGTYTISDERLTPAYNTVTATSDTMVAKKPEGTADPRREQVHAVPSGQGTRAPAYDAFAPWQIQRRMRLSPVVGPPSEFDCADFARQVLQQIPAFADQDPFDPSEKYGLRRLEPQPPSPNGFPTLPQNPEWPSPTG